MDLPENKPKKSAWPLAALLLCTALVSVAFAGAVEIGYNKLRAAPSTRSFPLTLGVSTAALDSPAAVDSSTWATPVEAKPTQGNLAVSVLCESNTASATATVKCGLYFYDGSTYTFLGEAPLLSSTATATAGASTVTDGSLIYPSNLVRFDTAGATHYDVRITTISAGNLTVKRWSYGVMSQ